MAYNDTRVEKSEVRNNIIGVIGIMNKYQVRYAGGNYWLLDMEQNGLNYKIPPALNETGIYIYRKLCEGQSAAIIAQNLHEDFDIEVDEALEDVKFFIDDMIEKGILGEG